MEPVSLDSLEIHRSALLLTLPSDSMLADRLRDMGLRIGTEIVKTAAAPSGDPLLVSFGTSRLALRRDICREITVIPTEGI